MHTESLEAFIRNVSANICDESVNLLIRNASFRELKKGEAVLKAGEVCRAFYYVEKGFLRTYIDKDDHQINLNFTLEGDAACNLRSVKSRMPSDSVIAAGEDSLIYIFNIDTIAAQTVDFPQISVFVRRLAIRLLLASETHHHLFKLYTAAERYQYIEKERPELLQRVSLSQIASYIGMSRETLSRIRGKAY